MDEVLTGFRVTRSGWYGGREGVAGDLMTFGKVMGGGLPAAVFGGRAEIMDRLGPSGPVYQTGTLSGNPLATAAGLATLRESSTEVYRQIYAPSAAVAKLTADALTEAGVPFRLQEAILFSFFLGVTEPVRDFGAARGQSSPAYAAFFHAMLDRGVYLPPSPFEPGSCRPPMTMPPSTTLPTRCLSRQLPLPERSARVWQTCDWVPT